MAGPKVTVRVKVMVEVRDKDKDRCESVVMFFTARLFTCPVTA
jgi:hypothetical protein